VYNENIKTVHYDLLRLKVNEPSCNWSWWRWTPRCRHHWIRPD